MVKCPRCGKKYGSLQGLEKHCIKVHGRHLVYSEEIGYKLALSDKEKKV